MNKVGLSWDLVVVGLRRQREKESPSQDEELRKEVSPRTVGKTGRKQGQGEFRRE